MALPSHRAIRHHTQGIFAAEYEFGLTIQNSRLSSSIFQYP